MGLFGTRLDAKKGGRSRKKALPVEHLHRLECKTCPLRDLDCNHPKLEPAGSTRADVYVLGESPSYETAKTGKHFCGHDEVMLREALAGTAVRWNYTVRDPILNPGMVEVECCRPSIIRDIEKVKPKVLVTVGGFATSWALNTKGNMKKITLWRGRHAPVKIGDHVCWVAPVGDPDVIAGMMQPYNNVNHPHYQAFLADIRRLLDGVDEWGVAPYEPEKCRRANCRPVYGDDAAFREILNTLKRFKRTKTLTVDIETNQLRPFGYKRRLLSLAVGTDDDVIAFPVDHPRHPWSAQQTKRLLKAIEGLLRGPKRKIIAHNLSFELEWFITYFGEDIARACDWQDTMQQAYILDEREGGHSLDFLVRLHFGFGLKGESEVDRNDLEYESIEELLTYNALDVKYTHKLFVRQKQLLALDELEDTYQMQLERVPTITLAQVRGFPVDQEVRKKFSSHYETTLNKLVRKIQKDDAVVAYKKRYGGEFNPGSPEQVKKIFRDVIKTDEIRTGANSFSTKAEVLRKVKHPLSDHIIKYRNLVKFKGTYIDVLDPEDEGSVVWSDGCVHTTFNMTRTATGRLSSDGPNLQNYPKRSGTELRTMHAVPEGFVLLSGDFGQIEARVIAVASDDKLLIRSIKEGFDIHLGWSEFILETLEKHLGAAAKDRYFKRYKHDIKKLRGAVKNQLVFPAFYGASPKSLGKYLNLPETVIDPIFAKFWAEHRAVKRWQDATMQFYRRHGYVESLTGRRRRAPLTKNMIMNTPIQAAASDVVIDAMNRLSVRAQEEGKPWLQAVLNIHDDLTFIVPQEHVEDAAADVVEEMLVVPSWCTVPLSVELEVGTNWGEQEPVGTFTSED